MIRRPANEHGYVLIDALVAVVIVAMAGVGIFQFGTNLLNRSATDVSDSAAITNLHALSVILGARGEAALSLLPSEDERFRYASRAPSKGDAPADSDSFHWVELVATDRSDRERETIVVGFVR